MAVLSLEKTTLLVEGVILYSNYTAYIAYITLLRLQHCCHRFPYLRCLQIHSALLMRDMIGFGSMADGIDGWIIPGP